jgi:hypothetical protein
MINQILSSAMVNFEALNNDSEVKDAFEKVFKDKFAGKNDSKEVIKRAA